MIHDLHWPSWNSWKSRMTRHAVAPYAERLSYVPDAFDLGVAQTVGAWSARLARIAERE